MLDHNFYHSTRAVSSYLCRHVRGTARDLALSLTLALALSRSLTLEHSQIIKNKMRALYTMLLQNDARTIISALKLLRSVVRCHDYTHAFEFLEAFSFAHKPFAAALVGRRWVKNRSVRENRSKDKEVDPLALARGELDVRTHYMRLALAFVQSGDMSLIRCAAAADADAAATHLPTRHLIGSLWSCSTAMTTRQMLPAFFQHMQDDSHAVLILFASRVRTCLTRCTDCACICVAVWLCGCVCLHRNQPRFSPSLFARFETASCSTSACLASSRPPSSRASSSINWVPSTQRMSFAQRFVS